MTLEQLDKIIHHTTETERTTPFIIALEGPVCAGKSTMLELIKAKGIDVIVEYSEYVASATKDFPKFPPANEPEAQNSFHFFLELEAKRAQNLKSYKGNPVVLDRSIYTLLAFEAGAKKLTGIDISPWATEALVNQRGIIVPDHVVYMDVNPEISRRRARDAGIRIPDFLFSKQFNSGFRNFFIRLKERTPDYVTVVDATGKQEDVLNEIEEITSALAK